MYKTLLGNSVQIFSLLIMIQLVELLPLTTSNIYEASTSVEMTAPFELAEWNQMPPMEDNYLDKLRPINQDRLWNALFWAMRQNRLQKRHLFISDGWGPGGRQLAIGKATQQNNRNNNQTMASSKVRLIEKPKKPNKNEINHQYHTLKWSIPGLFGQF